MNRVSDGCSFRLGVKVPQKRSDCSEKCYCNCNNDCCSPEQDFFSPTTALVNKDLITR